MKSFMRTEVGRGISGIAISIGLTVAVLLPVVVMEVFSKLFGLI